MKQSINVLFLGDIVGRPGRTIVKDFLQELGSSALSCESIEKEGYDFIGANVENASHGFGLTHKNYNEFAEWGVDIMTSGNHIWDKKEVFEYIESADRLIRPMNYPTTVPGVGSRIFEKNGISIGVINLLGRVFMPPIDSPWEILEKEVKRLKEITPIIIVDFHAEATAEKISFGYFADELGVSAVLGTHTHVQTADEKILKNGCAYISDLGLCGASNAVIGMDYNSSLKRLVTGLPERFDVAPMDKTELRGVSITIDSQSGNAQCIKRICYEKNYCEVI